MDPEQIAALLAAAGTLLGAIGLRGRREAFDGGRGTTAGLAVARAGVETARIAGNVAATSGRVAVDIAAAGIRVGGAAVAHSAGLVVDGTGELSRRAGRALAWRSGPIGSDEGRDAPLTASLGRGTAALEAPPIGAAKKPVAKRASSGVAGRQTSGPAKRSGRPTASGERG